MSKSTIVEGNQGKNSISSFEKTTSAPSGNGVCIVCGKMISADTWTEHQQFHWDFYKDLTWKR